MSSGLVLGYHMRYTVCPADSADDDQGSSDGPTAEMNMCASVM